MKKMKTLLVAVLATAALSACGGGALATGAHEHEARSNCRSECGFSSYDDGVGTDCYGDCMWGFGYYCHRQWSGEHIGDVYLDPPPDHFDCSLRGGWGVSKEYAKCAEGVKLNFTDTEKSLVDQVKEKCGSPLLKTAPQTTPTD